MLTHLLSSDRGNDCMTLCCPQEHSLSNAYQINEEISIHSCTKDNQTMYRIHIYIYLLIVQHIAFI